MGQPAARVGDSTAHGGVIVAGAPTVFIGKMPAARLGDPHVCPLVTPGTPPVPHVGMPIVKGSSGVMIGGMPAARVGDMAPCTGPPDSIVMGCTTVMIGETMPGGGGGGGASAQQSQASYGAALSAAIAAVTPQEETQENHFIDVIFKDSAGLPVAFGQYIMEEPDGRKTGGAHPTQIKRFGVAQGQYTISLSAITGVRWSMQEARDEETVTCIVETSGIEDGTEALLQIWMRNINSPDKLVTTVEGLTLQSGSINYDWQPSFFSDSDAAEKGKGFLAPFFFFTVTIGGKKERSGLLVYRDWIEIELCDEEDNPVADTEYRVTLSSGEMRTGKTDSNGYAKEDNIPPGNCTVEFPELNEQ